MDNKIIEKELDSEVSEEEEEEEEEEGKDEPEVSKQLEFARVIRKHRVLLNKSQVPSIKKKKDKAMDSAISDLGTLYGQKYDKKKLMKKVSRMKTEVKEKADKKKTGNKKIVLKEWEQIIYDLIGAENNPTIGRIEGAVQVGEGIKIKIESEVLGESSSSIPPRPKKNEGKRSSDALLDGETDETRALSTSQVQRLLMIEQINYIRKKSKKLDE